MLEHLYIRNFTIIDELDIPFFPGFSVITGETGAGKSIILGAIGLLLGERADAKLVKAGEKKCTIEGHFRMSDKSIDAFLDENDIDSDEICILRRELTDTGKSRAFINDTPVTLPVMKALGGQLLDIHSQHQNLLLQKNDFQMHVIDIVANNETVRSEYRDNYIKYKDSEKKLVAIEEAISNSKEEEEFLRFQYQELDNAHLVEGMQEELEQEQDMLEHAEDIKSTLSEVANLLDGENYGVLTQLRSAGSLLDKIESVYPSVTSLVERMESTRIELLDIAEDISYKGEDIDVNPNRLQEINNQLDTIYHLEHKHHVTTVEELIAIRNNLQKKIESIDNSDEELELLQKQVEQLRKTCMENAQQISKTRKNAAKTIETDLQNRLVPLGIPNVKFQVVVENDSKKNDGDIELTPSGIDKIQFLFSANKNTALRPIAEVASGGEIARVMLAIKSMVSGFVKLPTIIFDEVDTGTSGKIAQQMAFIMKDMGENDRQVITITHLPQIAALGSHHYKVYKDEDGDTTTSHMQLLSEGDRVQEIAQMLSGNNITDAAIKNAKELLNYEKN